MRRLGFSCWTHSQAHAAGSFGDFFAGGNERPRHVWMSHCVSDLQASHARAVAEAVGAAAAPYARLYWPLYLPGGLRAAARPRPPRSAPGSEWQGKPWSAGTNPVSSSAEHRCSVGRVTLVIPHSTMSSA